MTTDYCPRPGHSRHRGAMALTILPNNHKTTVLYPSITDILKTMEIELV